jgi:hypothetical protein
LRGSVRVVWGPPDRLAGILGFVVCRYAVRQNQALLP